MFKNRCVDGSAPALLAERGRCLALLALRAACGWLFAFGYLRFAPVRFTRFEPAALREAWKAPVYFQLLLRGRGAFSAKSSWRERSHAGVLATGCGLGGPRSLGAFSNTAHVPLSTELYTHSPVETVEMVEVSVRLRAGETHPPVEMVETVEMVEVCRPGPAGRHAHTPDPPSLPA